VGLLALVIFFAGREEDETPRNDPIQVTLTDEIGMVSAAPDPSDEPPAPKAGEQAEPDDTEIAPPDSEPEPEPKPQPPKPAAKPEPQPKSTPRPPNSANASSKPNQKPNNKRDTSGLAGLDVSGPAEEKTNGKGDRSQASATGAEQANFLSAVKRQVQPCADRQNIPSAEAESIVAIVQLRLKPNGALESVRILRHEGVNDGNQRYVTRVDDAVEAVFKGCTPLRGLPADLYDVKGGWKSLTFRYQLSS
jgi:outer membrane biosynthesis protein TonB